MQKCAHLVELEKCCQTHIFLQNFVLIQPRTSPPKICQSFANFAKQVSKAHMPPGQELSRSTSIPAHPSGSSEQALKPASPRAAAEIFPAPLCKFLAGSFSAVSRRNFARKYAFDSIFQGLQDVHTFAPLRSQNFCKKSI